MSFLPKQFILFDTEFTAWEGSEARRWSGPNEHREIVQIGAIKVTDLQEEASFLKFVKPVFNPKLSDYFTNLTGIVQKTLDSEGVSYSSAIEEFKTWCTDVPLYSFGNDGVVLEENCALLKISCPFLSSQFNDVREIFESNGISTEGYMSSTIAEALGGKSERKRHDALNDARSILDGLVLLDKKLKMVY